jgi:hypothetical protein
LIDIFKGQKLLTQILPARRIQVIAGLLNVRDIPVVKVYRDPDNKSSNWNHLEAESETSED